MIPWPRMLGSGLAAPLPLHSPRSLPQLLAASGSVGLEGPQEASLLHVFLHHCVAHSSSLTAYQSKSRNRLESQGLNLKVVQHHFCLIRDRGGEVDSGSCWEDQWALRECRNGWWPSSETILLYTLYSCCEHDSKLKRKLLDPYLVHKEYKCLLLCRFKTTE